MFVLSVEGQSYVDRELWSTHKVLGVFEDRETALASPWLLQVDDESVVLLTDTEKRTVERVDR